LKKKGPDALVTNLISRIVLFTVRDYFSVMFDIDTHVNNQLPFTPKRIVAACEPIKKVLQLIAATLGYLPWARETQNVQVFQ
jgi:hypothetical protein